MKTITLTDDELEMLLTSLETLQKKLLDDDKHVCELVNIFPNAVTTDELSENLRNSARARLTIQHLANKLRTGEA